ncbi:MAG: hypothetical protein WDN48_13305 [Pseudolabrys sp.]
MLNKINYIDQANGLSAITNARRLLEMARILHENVRGVTIPAGVGSDATDKTVMNTDARFFGIVVGGIVVVAIVLFIFSGGELGGKQTIEGDDDLPPIANTDK